MSVPQDDANIPVLLLKTKSVPHDGYEEYFSHSANGNFEPTFVPVLEHRFRENTFEKLREWLSGAKDATDGRTQEGLPYGGMIFTSQRAVEAFSQIITELRDNGTNVCSSLDDNFPLYVVGPATARGLRSLGLACDIVGEESGTGEKLAHIILHDFAQRPQGHGVNKMSLLFLVGEQRRDIIPKTLQSAELLPESRVTVDEVVIYETGEMKSFRDDFKTVMASCTSQGPGEQWVVVFSPTGCRAMLETLDLLDQTTGRFRKKTTKPRVTCIATIGPTTRDYLITEFGFEPDVCAPNPSPEGVGNAIRQHIQQRARMQALEQNFATQIT